MKKVGSEKNAMLRQTQQSHLAVSRSSETSYPIILRLNFDYLLNICFFGLVTSWRGRFFHPFTFHLQQNTNFAVSYSENYNRIDMKNHLIKTALLSLIFLTIGSAKAQQAVQQLSRRILGDRASEIGLVVQKNDKPEKMEDFFRIECKEGKIQIIGNSDNSVAMGLNYYLRHYAHVYVSWNVADPIELPKKFPAVESEKPIYKRALVDNRFFLNYSTFGYTMPWWGWDEWERLIDWMALNGINMPLAQTGQEAVWYEVWKDYGMTDQEILSYFAAPAHLPWHRLGNLDGFQGPLTMSWINSQKELQKKIVVRERELNMRPVLSGFSGHVPQYIAEAYNTIKIKKNPSWRGFQSTYFLDPSEPLFAQIQQKFIEKQTALYGSDHLYAVDPFNDMDPQSWMEDYLMKTSHNIYESLSKADSCAKWVQTGWMFYRQSTLWNTERMKIYLGGVENREDLILLDYYCENTEIHNESNDFFGYPFIWCYLGNFGGNTKLSGNVYLLNEKMSGLFGMNANPSGASNMQKGKNKPIGKSASQKQNNANRGTTISNMTGIGATLEALDCNPVMYEFLFERVWQKDVDVDAWMKDWSATRFGKENENADAAWQLLSKNVYTNWVYDVKDSKLMERPAFPIKNNDKKAKPTSRRKKEEFVFSNDSLLAACQNLLKSKSKRDSYNNDLAVFYSQWMANYFEEIYNQFIEAYNAKDLKQMKAIKKQANELIDDADALLSTQPSMLLGGWLNAARNMGTTAAEKDYFEKNARTILTTWGSDESNDYACRMWGGLVKGYYGQRWNMFFDAAINAVENNRSVNRIQLNKDLIAFEQQWADQHDTYPTEPQGNAAKIAKKINKKINKYYVKVKAAKQKELGDADKLKKMEKEKAEIEKKKNSAKPSNTKPANPKPNGGNPEKK